MMQNNNIANQPSIEETMLFGKISSDLDNNNLKTKQIIDLLRENDITRSGIIYSNEFAQIVTTMFKFNMNDNQTLLKCYTTR